MSELSIKVIIAGRTYPLTINREEEERIRKAAAKINSNIKDLQDNYAVKDMQDLLSMTALQFASDNLDKNKVTETDNMVEEINNLNQEIESYLS